MSEENKPEQEMARQEETQPAIDAAASLQEELSRSKSDYLYLRAEYDNFRRQSIKERAELLRFAGERLAKDLLETLDIFDSALATDVSASTLEQFVSGIQLTAQQLKSTLQKHNISEVPSLGLAFDPSLHEALGSEPNEKIPEGHVTRVFKKPYKFHDKVLRTGQVIVAKPKA